MKLLEYAEGTKRFSNLFADLPEVFPLVASGMSVKLYADKTKSKKGKSRYLDTSDLDVTVFVTQKVSIEKLRHIVSVVFERYDDACEDYTRYYNRTNDSQARLLKRCPGKSVPKECPIDITRKQGEPFFDRHVYAFKKYSLKTTDEVHELMDVAIAYQPGMTSGVIDRRMSTNVGVPLPRVPFLIHELTTMVHVDILGKSPFNKKRHPVSGKEFQKGLKDLHRLRFILTKTRDVQFDRHRLLVKHLLNVIAKHEYTNEKKIERLQQILKKYNLL